jgi:hypothetical protein
MIQVKQDQLPGYRMGPHVWQRKRDVFSLNLNAPRQPGLLYIGNDPTLKETFSSVVSCIITVAIKLMNQQHKHRSYVLLDEAATVYVPGQELLLVTSRSYQVASIYMTQDLTPVYSAVNIETAHQLQQDKRSFH